MTTSAYFSADYTEARKKFLTAARSSGATLSTYVHPRTGAKGEELAADVAILGPEEPSAALLIVAGTHGVEGFCGSGCQVGFLHDRLFELATATTAVILIHAINPYGFSWLCRVNEDNVDLNRNFRDFSRPLPSSEAYEEIHEFLVPREWVGPERDQADAKLRAYVERGGMKQLQAAVQGGQYTRPTGLMFGGREPVWSNVTFQRIMDERLAKSVQHLAVIDVHTGLGAPGYGEILYAGTSEAERSRLKDWLGSDVKSPSLGDSVSASVDGALLNAVPSFASQIVEYSPVALEFGTVPMLEVLEALRADNWLREIQPQSSLEPDIKRQLRRAFYTDSPSWKAVVYGRFADVVNRISRRLA
jgi:hypothetical protein